MNDENRADHGDILVTLSGVRKSFGSVRALETVDLNIPSGECLALLGHNGAGKSTLVNLINGSLAPTEGTVDYLQPDGSRQSGSLARRAGGVRAVHQELSLCPNLTVAENIRISQHDLNGLGWRKKASERIKASLDKVFPNNRIQPDMMVGDLTLAERQMVEISIGFASGTEEAKLVILDEPTSSLDASIATQLLDYVSTFCAQGGAVVFITHMMGEVFQVASRIAVMQDGKIVEERPTDQFTRESLVAAMGHVAHQSGARRVRPDGTDIVSTPDGLKARKGEIVGLAGLAGHGQAEALARFYMANTSNWRGGDPEVVFVAGDRVRDGAFVLWSILQNASIAGISALTKFGIVDEKREAELVEEWKEKIAIRTQDTQNLILSLSGGNQQKVLFARAFATDAPIVVMDDPMRGVDVGTKAQVYDMISQEAESGRTLFWYSTEVEETMLCDRVFVFRNGEISAELIGDEITEANILANSFEMQESAA